MITACITIRGQPEKRTEILQTIKGIKEQLDRKTTCREVMIYQDVDDENTFLLVEEWPSEDELDEYLSSRLFKVLLGINSILEEPLEMKVFGFLRKPGL